MRTVRDIPGLSDATVLLRADLDVPVAENGLIEEEFRIIQQKENLDFLLSGGARVVMVAHASDPQAQSFRGLLPQLKRLFGREISFLAGLEDIRNVSGRAGSFYLLDNVRRWPEETRNDAAFAAELADGFDVYVNNAFAVVHREHASVSAAAFIKPAYAGLLVEKEIRQLSDVIDAPAEGKVLIMGGAKASTKVPVISNLIAKAEHVLVGGIVANDILKAKGQDIGSSRVDDNIGQLLKGLDLDDPRLHVPDDSVVEEGAYMDLGPNSVHAYTSIIKSAKTVIWNGPVGKFEDIRFAGGTLAIARAIVDSGAFSLIGGGDTIAAVSQAGLLNRFGHVSTGGGAMLAFLSGERLPGLVPLGVYPK
ncbi:MAG TPA: phosphoglycerate kinase [Candidatus Paceibacterota bacterium]|nr:phosphoglycerate kinase [Candidatus Paceibacterota bacterium]